MLLLLLSKTKDVNWKKEYSLSGNIVTIVFVEKSFETRCEFCEKEFKSLNRHIWRCSARVINRDRLVETSSEINSSNDVLSQSNSILTTNLNNSNVESNKDYDPHENEKEERKFRCYCGREFNTLRGLNTHRRSCHIYDIPDIKDLVTATEEENEDQFDEELLVETFPKSFLKIGVKLPKSDGEWEQANEFFRETLSIDPEINDLNSEITNLHETIYNLFADTCGKTTNSSTEYDQRYEKLTKNQLKKALKLLKLQEPSPVSEIKYVSRMLRNIYRSKKDDDNTLDHQKLYGENF